MAHSVGEGTIFLWSWTDIIVIGEAISADEIQAIPMRHRTARRETNRLAWRACSGFRMPK